MQVLDDIILVVNKEIGVDICNQSRQFPYPWAKALYTHFAYENTSHTISEIMNRIGLDRSSFYSKIKTVEEMYEFDKEFRSMYDRVAEAVKEIEIVEEEEEIKTIVEVNLDKMKLLISKLDKKEFSRKTDRLQKKGQLLNIIDKLVDIETKRKKTYEVR